MYIEFQISMCIRKGLKHRPARNASLKRDGPETIYALNIDMALLRSNVYNGCVSTKGTALNSYG